MIPIGQPGNAAGAQDQSILQEQESAQQILLDQPLARPAPNKTTNQPPLRAANSTGVSIQTTPHPLTNIPVAANHCSSPSVCCPLSAGSTPRPRPDLAALFYCAHTRLDSFLPPSFFLLLIFDFTCCHRYLACAHALFPGSGLRCVNPPTFITHFKIIKPSIAYLTIYPPPRRALF